MLLLPRRRSQAAVWGCCHNREGIGGAAPRPKRRQPLDQGGFSVRRQGAYQNRSCTEPLAPANQTSMLPPIRDTAAMKPRGDTLPAPTSSNPCQLAPSSQKRSSREPFAPMYQTSMLRGTRDTAAIDPLV